ncbi:MAG TPA: hypothetical protein VFO68_27310, partial [Actinophytocola sp.]|nr:hypothetical protein [Actinophytocola sp.]
LGAAVDLAGTLLRDGVPAGGALAATFARTERALAGLRYPLAAVADLADQLSAYRARAAHYRPERVADLIAELHARDRAVRAGGATPAARVLGSDEPAETPLHRVRLTGLGCRVTGGTAEVYLADPAGMVLVLRGHWPGGQTGAELAGRRMGGSTLAALAAGTVVSESATRSASRTVRLTTGRVGKTTVTPSTGWDALSGAVLVRDLAALDRALAQAPPRLVRPRVAAEHLRAVAVAEVLGIGYHPGDQRLEALVADPAGGTARVSATYRPAAPGALDALDSALRADPRFLAGTVRRTGGTVVIDPTAVLVGSAVVVPDLAPGDGAADLSGATPEPPDRVTAALDAAVAVCAEAAHRGLRHLPAGFAERVGDAAADLLAVGLPKAAATLTRFAEALTDPVTAGTAWVDAQIRISTTRDAR